MQVGRAGYWLGLCMETHKLHRHRYLPQLYTLAGSPSQAIFLVMAPFNHRPLAQNKKQIRILTPKPAPWDSVIECELETIDLDDPIAASYEALSYVWGSKDPPAKLMLHSSEHIVTPSLASA